MACTIAISSVSNTIKKFHRKSNLLFFQKNVYHDKQNIMDELFHQCHLPLLKYIDNTELITEWKQNIYYALYEKI